MTTPAGLYIAHDGNWWRGPDVGPGYGVAGLNLDWPYGAAGTYEPGPGKVGLPSTVDPDTLATYDGPSTIATSGLRLSRMRFNYAVTVASNVTGVVFDQCDFVGEDSSAFTTSKALIRVNSGGSVTIKDSKIRPAVISQWWEGVDGYGSFTLERCDISGGVDGCDPFGDTTYSIKGCWIHDLYFQSPSTQHSDNKTHSDGIQVQGGSGEIIGNLIEGYADMTISSDGLGVLPAGHQTNSAIMVRANASNIGAWTITDNWLHGGMTTLNANHTTGDKTMSNSTSVLRNKFQGTATSGDMNVSTGITWNFGTGDDINVKEGTSTEATIVRV